MPVSFSLTDYLDKTPEELEHELRTFMNYRDGINALMQQLSDLRDSKMKHAELARDIQALQDKHGVGVAITRPPDQIIVAGPISMGGSVPGTAKEKGFWASLLGVD